MSSEHKACAISFFFSDVDALLSLALSAVSCGVLYVCEAFVMFLLCMSPEFTHCIEHTESCCYLSHLVLRTRLCYDRWNTLFKTVMYQLKKTDGLEEEQRRPSRLKKPGWTEKLGGWHQLLVSVKGKAFKKLRDKMSLRASEKSS